MSKLKLGILSGALLGTLDGMTAMFVPGIEDILLMIIAGSALNGIIIGVLIALITRKRKVSLGQSALIGLAIGLVVSAVTALLTSTYFEVIVPGAVVGLLTGLIVAKWGAPAYSTQNV